MYKIELVNDFSELTGQELVEIRYKETVPHCTEALFFITKRDVFLMTHYYDCCEYVRLEDVIGDPSGLKDVFISMAESVSNYSDKEHWSQTYTFYKLQTRKGDLTIRWFGESNGYYSESVDIYRIIEGFDRDETVEFTMKG